MRTSHWIGVTILALIVGGAVGYLLAPLEPVAPGVQPLNTADPSDPAPATDSQAAMEIEDENGAELEPTVPTNSKVPADPATVDADEDLLIRALKSIEPLAAITGDRKITGYVRTPDGDPVAGVRITAVQKHSFSYPGRPEFDSAEDPRLWEFLVEHVKTRVQQEIYPLQGSPSVETNSEGYYELDGLADETARVRATRAGYKLEAQGRTYLKPDAELDWIASRAGLVTVSVTGASEEEAGSLYVYYRSSAVDAVGQSIRLAEAKTFEVGEGTWEIWAEDRQSKLTSEVTTVKVEGEAGPIVVQLVLKTPPDIELKVIVEGGTLVGGFRVSAAPLRADLLPEEHFDERRRLTTDLRRTGEEGVYRSTLLEPGEYVVGVLYSQRILATTRVVVSEQRAYSTITLGAPAAHAGVRCVVEVPAGEKTSQLQFFIYMSESSKISFQTWEMSDGAFLLVPQREPPGEVASFSVEAHVPTLGTQSRTVSTLKGSSAAFKFEEPAELYLKVTNVPESLARNLAINYRLPNGRTGWRTPGSWGRTPKSDDGEILIQAGKVQPGTYEYWIQGGHHNGTPELARASVVVEAAKDVIVEMRLVDLFEVTIEASGVEVYTWMALHWEGQPNEQGTSLHMDKDGKCIIPFLPAGTYTLKYRVKVHNARERTFTVKENATVYLTE